MITIKEISFNPKWWQIAAIILSLAIGYCLIKYPEKTVDNAKEIMNVYQEKSKN